MSKNPSYESFLEKVAKLAYGEDSTRQPVAGQYKCIACRAEVNTQDPEKSFKDFKSFQEFSISRLCQKCQDSVFESLADE